MNRSDLPFTRAEFASMPLVNLLQLRILGGYGDLPSWARRRARHQLRALDVLARLVRTARRMREICMMKAINQEMRDEPARTITR